MRDISFRANPPNVLFVRDKFKMVWIHASSVPAQMVKLKAIRNGAVLLFPKPDVAKIRLVFPANARIPIGAWLTNYPTSGFRIRLRNSTPAMAGVIHLRLPGDIPQPRVLGNRRCLPAPAEAFTSSTDSLGGDFVVALQKMDVASGYPFSSRVGSICNANGCPAAAPAFSGGIRPSRIVWFDRVSAGLPLGPMACQIAKEFTRYLV